MVQDIEGSLAAFYDARINEEILGTEVVFWQSDYDTASKPQKDQLHCIWPNACLIPVPISSLTALRRLCSLTQSCHFKVFPSWIVRAPENQDLTSMILRNALTFVGRALEPTCRCILSCNKIVYSLRQYI